MNRKSTIYMLAYTSCSLNCRIMAEAVKQLAENGFGIIVTIDEIISGIDAHPLLVIDGTNESLGLSRLCELGMKPDFHLKVTDLGIEAAADECCPEDLTLVKDAIQAECTVTDGAFPKFNCPCCG